jgi:hypothetical protein
MSLLKKRWVQDHSDTVESTKGTVPGTSDMKEIELEVRCPWLFTFNIFDLSLFTVE